MTPPEAQPQKNIVESIWDKDLKPISDKRENLILKPIRHVDGDPA